MLYLYKEITSSIGESSHGGKQDLQEHFKFFGFHRRINNSQFETFNELIKDKAGVIADIVAAHTANLFKAEVIKRRDLIWQSLQCCRDLIIDRGYDEVDEEKILDISKSVRRNIVLTAGCQSDEILERRVLATEEFCYGLMAASCNVDIVLSGNNPNFGSNTKEKVKIQNESVRMRQIFQEKLGRRKNLDFKRFLKIEILEEGQSAKSGQNVERFIDMKLSTMEQNQCNIFVVSSTFHLIRLSAEIEKHLMQKPTAQVKNIVLIGAENVTGMGSLDSVSMHDAYVKSMIFEIYRCLVNLPEYLNIRA